MEKKGLENRHQRRHFAIAIEPFRVVVSSRVLWSNKNRFIVFNVNESKPRVYFSEQCICSSSGDIDTCDADRSKPKTNMSNVTGCAIFYLVVERMQRHFFDIVLEKSGGHWGRIGATALYFSFSHNPRTRQIYHTHVSFLWDKKSTLCVGCVKSSSPSTTNRPKRSLRSSLEERCAKGANWPSPLVAKATLARMRVKARDRKNRTLPASPFLNRSIHQLARARSRLIEASSTVQRAPKTATKSRRFGHSSYCVYALSHRM